MSYTLNLEAKLENLFDLEIRTEFKGFLFNNKLISVHHGEPIIDISTNNQNLDVLINTVWNELLVLSVDGLDLSRYQNIQETKLSFPNKKETMILRYENEDIYFQMEDIEYFYINNIPSNPRNVYIKASKRSNNSLASMSGSPVFSIDNKLVGVFCKESSDYIYILPACYIIKTLAKCNNSDIYSINFPSIIRKVNNNIVGNDNNIFSRTLNYKIPLDVYFTLEGDKNSSVMINNTNISYESINHFLPISNERRLIKNGNIYKVNSALLMLIKKLNPNMGETIRFIFRNIDKDLYITLDEEGNSLFTLHLEDYIIHFIST
jgi:hypothetical protein